MNHACMGVVRAGELGGMSALNGLLIKSGKFQSVTSIPGSGIYTTARNGRERGTNDYANMKGAELQALLKSRSLPHSGKKSDMVARLLKDDKNKEG